MVEVKASSEAEDKDVLAKAKEGINWCHHASTIDPDKKRWEYRLITDNNIAVGNTFNYTIGTAKIISED